MGFYFRKPLSLNQNPREIVKSLCRLLMYVPKRELSKSQICLLTLFKNKSLAKGFEFTVIENIHVKSLENLG